MLILYHNPCHNTRNNGIILGMKSSKGFTVIELLFIVVILVAASVVFFIQRNNVETAARDSQRKTAINAMYYGLEEVYYGKNKYYPVSIDSKLLSSVDPILFTDPDGNEFGSSASQYHYEGTNCNNNQCKSYTLRADLENEEDYVKTSRHN